MTAAPGVFIDWDNDGFGTGAHDNVTSDVISWSINRGAAAEIVGAASPGSATLVLKNPSGIYNPQNASGALYGKLNDGVPIWIGINDLGRFTGGSSVYGLFGGRITDITPIPAAGASIAPTVEIVCEDALNWYGRQPVLIADSITRSQGSLRQAVLDAIGETRYTLASEITTLPLSSASGDALSVLSSINAANGTRHYIKPGAQASDWYTYKTAARMEHLTGVADSSISAASQHVTGSTGWRKSGSTVINEQRATITPISFPLAPGTVWTADPATLPLSVVNGTPVTVWANFADFVSAPTIVESHTGAMTTAITPFGTTAKLVLTCSSGTAVVSILSVSGLQVIREPSITVVADDLTSQAPPRGVRAAPEIVGDFVGTAASAVGITSHIVWRYGNPQVRPSLTVHNWLPTMFVRDLFDVLAVTSPQLSVSGLQMEIIGLTHQAIQAATGAVDHVVTYQLQESRVQTPTSWFTWGVSKWGPTGTDLLGF